MRINLKYIAPTLGVAGIIAAVFIAPREGQIYTAYQDGVDVWTICRGHTKGVTKGMTATEDQCAQFYAEDLAVANADFHRLVPKPQHPNVKAASISFIFNVGSGNFAKSTLRKKLNAGDRVGACNEFPRWHFASGKDCNVKANKCYGIVARRQAEKELCLADNINICPDLGFDDFGGCLQIAQLEGSGAPL